MPSTLIFLFFVLPVEISSAGGPHRPILKKQETGKTAPPKAEEAEENAEPQPRFPLFLTPLGPETGRPGSSDPAIPAASEFLVLFDSVLPLRLNPWVLWGEGVEVDAGIGQKHKGESHLQGERRRARLAYLAEKSRLFDEIVRTASEVSSMAESLADAGQWSPADAAILRVDEERLRIYRKEIDEQVARLKGTGTQAPEAEAPELPRGLEVPAVEPDASESVRRIVLEAGSVHESLKTYNEKLLPALEEILRPAEEAYDHGEVGLTTLAQYRTKLLVAKIEALNLVYRLDSLLLDLEEAAGGSESGSNARGDAR